MPPPTRTPAATPNAVGAAYTNSFADAGATRSMTSIQPRHARDPKSFRTPARLHTVGPLGVDTSDVVGFDISGTTGVAFASLTVAGVDAALHGQYSCPAPRRRPTRRRLRHRPGDTRHRDCRRHRCSREPRLTRSTTSRRAPRSAAAKICSSVASSLAAAPAHAYPVRGIGPEPRRRRCRQPARGSRALTLFNKNGVAITKNDNWKSDAISRRDRRNWPRSDERQRGRDLAQPCSPANTPPGYRQRHRNRCRHWRRDLPDRSVRLEQSKLRSAAPFTGAALSLFGRDIALRCPRRVGCWQCKRDGNDVARRSDAAARRPYPAPTPSSSQSNPSRATARASRCLLHTSRKGVAVLPASCGARR